MRLRKAGPSFDFETSGAIDRALAFAIIAIALLVALGIAAVFGFDDTLARVVEGLRP
jgi:hypothetical protein